MTHNLPKCAANTGQDLIVLVPQPSDDPNDPLNWPLWKKNSIFLTLCLGGFGGMASCNVHQLAYVSQASYYHRPIAQLSYSVSAGIAGLICGPLLFVPLSSIFGRSSLVFWSLVCTFAFDIWGPLMTGPDDFIPFVISRLMAGLAGAIPVVFAAGYIMDLYFLHQRGKAFAVLEVSLLSGVIVMPGIGGFIVDSRPWPDVFWLVAAINGLGVLMAFFLLEDTRFAEGQELEKQPRPDRSYLGGRITLLCPGKGTVSTTSMKDLGRRYINPILIGLSPVTILAGLFTIAIFGFFIGLGVTSSIFLQTPVAEGGYGFTPLQNAAFSTTWWFSVIACQLCGYLLNDRVPLRFARQTGVWHPEYRLWTIFVVVAASPIGIGMYGAGLQYHLHYMVLAVGTFLVVFAAAYSTPVLVNYITECFPELALEVSVIMSLYRQIFGLSVPFFIIPWTKRVGTGWAFGMMAFLCVFVSSFMILLIWKGQVLRKYSLVASRTEDGMKVLAQENGSEGGQELREE